MLTGTASLFRTYALKAVADSRGQLLPGDPGRGLRHAGDDRGQRDDAVAEVARREDGLADAVPCRHRVMPTWRALWRQRMRWQRGALENIGAYGLTRATLRYWLQQIGDRLRDDRAQRLLAPAADHAARGRRLPVHLVLGGIGPIFIVERVVTVWAAGWRAGARAPTGDRDRLRPRAAGRVRQIDSSTSPPAAQPAGTTSPARWPPRRRLPNDDPGRDPFAQPTSSTQDGSRPSQRSSRSTP